MQTIFKVVLPAAKSGVLSATVLGVGRAIGETMAVMMIAGNPHTGAAVWTLVHGAPSDNQYRNGDELFIGAAAGDAICHRCHPVLFYHDCESHATETYT